MCMRPPNPIQQYKQGGLQAALTPPGMPTPKEVLKDPKATLNPRLALARFRGGQ